MMWLLRRCLFAVTVLLFVAATGCADDTEGDNANQQNQGHDAVDNTANGDTGPGDRDQDAFDEADPLECAFPPEETADCPDGEFGPASFIAEFEINTDADEPCCFDLSGQAADRDDPDPTFYDNYIGEEVIGTIEGSGISGFEDVNDTIQNSIELGNLTYLLEARDWRHPEWDQQLELNIFRGGETEDIDDSLRGDGVFWADPANFDSDGASRFQFDRTEVRDGRMRAYDGTAEIGLPDLVDDLWVRMVDVQLEADVHQDPELEAHGSFGLGHILAGQIYGGKMGGIIVRDDFYKSMNEVSFECDCLDNDDVGADPDPYEDGLFEFSAPSDPDDPGTWVCMEGKIDEDHCENDPNQVCRTLGDQQFCNTLQLFSSNWDIETDEGVGYTVGIRFESVPTELAGVDD